MKALFIRLFSTGYSLGEGHFALEKEYGAGFSAWRL